MSKFNTQFMTPSELEAHKRIEAETASGSDPFGDENDEDLDGETQDIIAADAAAVAKAAETDAVVAETPAEAEPAPAEPVVAEAPAEAPAAAPAPAEPVVAEAPADPLADAPADLSDLKHLRLAPLPVVDQAAYETKRDELQAKIDEIDEQWENGVLPQDQRRAQLKPLKNELESLQMDFSSQVGAFQSIQRINHQTSQQVIERISAAGARDGLDYTEPAKGQQFDSASRAIQADPKNAKLSWVEVAALADRAVRAMNGVAVKAPPVAAPAPAAATPVAATPAPKPAPTRSPPPAPPTTLRTLPNAARTSEIGDTVSAKLMAADANQKDAIYRKLTPQQRAAMLDE